MTLALCKRATLVLCACNFVTILCILYTIFSPYLYNSTAYSVQSSWRLSLGANTSAVEAARIQEALKARKALEPVQLIKRVKEIQEETARGDFREKIAFAGGRKRNVEFAGKLKRLRKIIVKKNQQALEEWRKKKLETTKTKDYGSSSMDFIF